jgi:hypothetical protein
MSWDDFETFPRPSPIVTLANGEFPEFLKGAFERRLYRPELCQVAIRCAKGKRYVTKAQNRFVSVNVRIEGKGCQRSAITGGKTLAERLCFQLDSGWPASQGPIWAFSVCCSNPLILLVGAGRFERPTPCAQGRCATRLRYAPTSYLSDFKQLSEAMQ